MHPAYSIPHSTPQQGAEVTGQYAQPAVPEYVDGSQHYAVSYAGTGVAPPAQTNNVSY